MSAEKIVGVWDFTSMVVLTSSGEVVYPYGEDLYGRLIYTEGGHMCVLLMRARRPKFALDDPFAGTPTEKADAFDSFDAYCGTYEVDEHAGIITHRIEGSKFPNWLGSNQIRYFEFADQQLIIKAVIPVGGEDWHFEGVLQRLGP
jgi:hypothetical protein